MSAEEDEREDVAGDAADEEEEVELFSSGKPPASPSSPSLALSSSFSSEKTTPSPRRCTSRELLGQMPSLSTTTRYHQASVPAPFGCFHLMQLIEKSIQVGALFSTKLYAPKEIWQQDRVKLAGVALKMEIFQQFKQALERTSMHLPLTTDAGKAAFQRDLDALLEWARQERAHLERAFPFLHVDAKTASSSPSSAAPGPGDQAAEAEATTSLPAAAALAATGVGKLTNLAFGFGRMVKKQAIAAVERVGAVQPTAVPRSELEEYAAVLSMFFNSTRNIELLLGLSADADGTQEQVNELQLAENPQLDDATLLRLRQLAIFLDEVVVELVTRDVQLLLEAYLRRVTRSFGEFTVEQALGKRQPSISA